MSPLNSYLIKSSWPDTTSNVPTISKADTMNNVPCSLSHKGYGLEDDIVPFINDFGKPNKICSMCCSTKDSEIDHFAPGMVRNKKK